MRRGASLGIVAALALPALAAEPAPDVACARLPAEIARVEQAWRQAVDDAGNAWKAVLPFAVLARKASATSAATKAAAQRAELHEQARRCSGAAAAPAADFN